ncbi:MAG: hypothetical protein EU541_08115, partial [Promethearchaeota archaeon]
IADPYLAKFAKTYHPKLKLKVSVISEVNSLSRALKWQEIIGEDGVLTLSIMLTRNFPLLKEIVSSVNCDIEVLTNDCCLNECPFRFFHYNECSHASQDHDVLEAYYNDWSSMACQNQKAFHPEQLIMCKWIHPSDIDKYIDIGIDYFKISGRRYATEWLARVLDAYHKKSYNDNMGKILNGYSFVADPLELAGGQFSEYASKQEKVGGYPDDAGIMLSIPDFNAKLEASNLETLLENMPFDGAKCAENCGVSCTYCYNFVNKAYNIPSEENAELYKNYMAYLLDYLNYGEMFIPADERKLKPPIDPKDSDSYFGITWTSDAKDFLQKTMTLIPDGMKEAANKAIMHTTERTAEKKELKEISRELVISIIIRLIPKTFKHDLIDFLIEQQIDPLKYLKDKEELEKIKSMPYGTPSEETQEDYISSENKLNTEEEWKEYLERYMKVYNELPNLKGLLEPVAPLVFQFHLSDKPEMNYWQFFTKNGIEWGMGEFSNDNIPKMIHTTDFNTIKMVNSGEINAIQVSMTEKYNISGDMDKLMKCAPLLPLNKKVHSKLTES